MYEQHLSLMTGINVIKKDGKYLFPLSSKEDEHFSVRRLNPAKAFAKGFIRGLNSSFIKEEIEIRIKKDKTKKGIVFYEAHYGHWCLFTSYASSKFNLFLYGFTAGKLYK